MNFARATAAQYRRSLPKLRFQFNRLTAEWRSACGRYAVWLQARLHNGETCWTARRIGESKWITGSKREAILTCREHLAKELAAMAKCYSARSSCTAVVDETKEKPE